MRSSMGAMRQMAPVFLCTIAGHIEIAIHGFRSSFRDNIGEETAHDFHTAEAALAHTSAKSKVAAAYARADLFDKRAAMMQDWEQYCVRDKHAPAAKAD
ncbi:integrase [Rhodoferax sp.]|uniref:integrase n=1 Tax=Rhodoferax sp. TaxID=50421 RepID=UPI002744F4AC|nr:integrase [Rhodoferax sp.]